MVNILQGLRKRKESGMILGFGLSNWVASGAIF
jgi:hypothetical protein